MINLKYVFWLLAFGVCICHSVLGQSSKIKENRQLQIQSNDYQTAKNALDEAIKNGDQRIIRIGLQHWIISIRIKSAEAMGEISDENFIPNLVEAFKENRATLRGGSDMIGAQKQLDSAIILALENITGLYLAPHENPSLEEMQNAIVTSQNWLDARHPKQN